MQKPEVLSQSQLRLLLNEWIASNGLQDYTTNQILANKTVADFVNQDKLLYDNYINYSGIRIKDQDFDGDWEEYYEYTSGIIVIKILDQNQDGINEREYEYVTAGR